MPRQRRIPDDARRDETDVPSARLVHEITRSPELLHGHRREGMVANARIDVGGYERGDRAEVRRAQGTEGAEPAALRRVEIA